MEYGIYPLTDSGSKLDALAELFHSLDEADAMNHWFSYPIELLIERVKQRQLTERMARDLIVAYVNEVSDEYDVEDPSEFSQQILSGDWEAVRAHFDGYTPLWTIFFEGPGVPDELLESSTLPDGHTFAEAMAEDSELVVYVDLPDEILVVMKSPYVEDGVYLLPPDLEQLAYELESA